MSYSLTFLANVLLSAITVALLATAISLCLNTALPTASRRRRLRLVTSSAAVVVVVKTVIALTMLRFGWPFAARTILLELPLLAVPTLCVAVASWLPERAAPLEPGRTMPARAVLVGALAVWATGTAAGVILEEFFLRRPWLLAPLAVSAAAAGLVARGLIGRERRSTPRWVQGVAGVMAVLIVAAAAVSWNSSRLPGLYDLGDLATHDAGGGPQPRSPGHGAPGEGAVSVATLTGPRDRPADVSYTIEAQETKITTGRRSRDALSFNGQIPGPSIRAREGDLIEVVLRNKDIRSGVSVHWHGYDVPNAEDGVAGVTQNAVPIGGTHTYRFLAEQVGTFWYHSHQASSTQVNRGLYGALVVLPRSNDAGVTDLVVRDHAWRGPGGFLDRIDEYDEKSRVERTVVEAGTRVRLRLINTSSTPQRYRLVGTDFRVTAIDGTDLNAPDVVRKRALFVAGGGRYDVEFTMPDGPVSLLGAGEGIRIALSRGEPPPVNAFLDWTDLDPGQYGKPLPAASLNGRVDRDFTMDIDRRLGMVDGRPGYFWSVNGYVYPRMPMYMVAEGDLVQVTIINRSLDDHPIHLHGHHMQVLERNGRRVSGSPWSSDTLNAAPGERYVVRFRADNPGIWMDHCHNLQHAAQGFVMHVGYEGVTSPYRIGRDSGNTPE